MGRRDKPKTRTETERQTDSDDFDRHKKSDVAGFESFQRQGGTVRSRSIEEWTEKSGWDMKKGNRRRKGKGERGGLSNARAGGRGWET